MHISSKGALARFRRNGTKHQTSLCSFSASAGVSIRFFGDGAKVISVYLLYHVYWRLALYISRKDRREAPVICSMLANECGACLSVASSLGARVDKCMEQIGNAVGLKGNIQRKAQLIKYRNRKRNTICLKS